MTHLNVLCAPPNGRNPGMASVDLAFAPIAEQLDARVTYWRLWDQSEWTDPPGGSRRTDDGFVDDATGLTYQCVRGRLNEFLEADAVVYWGDFLHMASYIDQTADVLSRRMDAMPRVDAEQIAADTLLLEGQPDDVLARTISFGTTLGFNRPDDYMGPYGVSLRNFVSRAYGAWFRDGYSARIGTLMRDRSTDMCWGGDAAFLTPGPQQSPSTSGVGVFIGRGAMMPEQVARIGRQLTSHLGAPHWIPWGDSPAMHPMWGRKRLRLAWPELEGAKLSPEHLRNVVRDRLTYPHVPSMAALFDQIASSRVILTDTYHLAVNAWRIGTPTVLLCDHTRTRGWNVNNGGGSFGRDKRHDLYSQLDALPLLLDPDDLPRDLEFRSLIDHLTDEGFRQLVHGRARQIGQRGSRLVAGALSSLSLSE